MAANWWRFNRIGTVVTFVSLIAICSATVTKYGKLIGAFNPNESLHDVAGEIHAINETAIWVTEFSYDGEAPDANFYAGNGDEPNATNGDIIPDENGLTTPLSFYSNANLILILPEGTTIRNIQWIAIWCSRVRVNFGSVRIPSNFDPPAPKSIGPLGFTRPVHNVRADDVTILNTKQIKFTNLFYDGFGPDAYFWTGNGTPDYMDMRIPHPVDSTDDLPRYDGEDVTITFPEDLTVRDVDFIGLWCVLARQNFGHTLISRSLAKTVPPFVSPATKTCKVLWADNFHITWIVDARNNKITLTFEGVVEEGEYMAFGISGQDSVTSMIGSDVTVVWIDPDTHQGQAQDYYLSAYSQCTPDDGRGACPDVLQDNGVENVKLISAKVRDGVTVITVERPLTTSDPRDKDIPTSGDLAVSWGIGFINPTGHVAKHHTRAIGDVIVNFGASSDCPVLTGPTVTPEPVEPWTIQPLYPSEDTPMVAVIGPAGDRKGYQGIAGQVGWGLAWYINGSIIPEIHVERGKTYTFEVYGGDDPSFLGTYHPFYITDSKDGGYDQKTESEKELETIYAAPVEGTLCEYMGGANPEDYEDFEDYFQTLNLTCPENAQAGVLHWTVAEDTPDLVYYQCYQHRFFGWKIHVLDPETNMTTATMPPVTFTTSEPTAQYYGKIIGSFEDGPTLHDVAGTVYAIDDKRLWIRGFTYDGSAPDAHFFVGNGSMPNASGSSIPDENGLYTKLSSYTNDNFILTFPDGVTLQTIQWISVWCVDFRVDFGSVLIPLNFDPPAPHSLGELGFTPRVHNVHADDVTVLNTKQIKFTNLFYDGLGPDAYFWTGNGTPDSNDMRIPHPVDSTDDLPKYDGENVTITFPEDLTVRDVDFIGLWCVAAEQDFGHLLINNSLVEYVPPFVPQPAMKTCKVLWADNFHISWIIDARNNKITLTFEGVVAEGEYMAFGISGQDSVTSMVGSDVTVVWINSTTDMQGQAQDYYLNAYSQCTPDDGRGACPDELQENGVENVVLISAEVRDGVTVITVERPLTTSDPRDKDIPTSGDVAVSWGIGFINPTGHVAKHHTRATGNVIVDFGASSSCPVLIGPSVTPETVEPWTIEPLYPSEDTPMVAVIGPAGDRRGYQGIAGQVGWGLAWYINGSIIPEIHVERGKTYTFEVYGGDDPSFLGTYHPFYITDSKDGGYDQKTESDKQLETIYAAPVEGTLCEYMGGANPEDFDNFEDYFQTLNLMCPENAQAGVLRWRVAEDTPDLVYYQCYQHRFFGWKIHVSDPGLNMTTTTMSPPVTTAPTTQYYGKFIGSFEDGRRLHDVAGKVYAIDNKRLWIRGFSYDGEAPDAHFFVGGGSEPSANGISIPDENGLYTELSSYSNDNIILTFPDGVTLQTIEWISVWCVEFQVDFGSVLIPLNFDPPAPHSLGELGFTPRVHNVHADDVTILNTKQIKFTNLFYDGFGPDAYFWTGNGTPDYKDTRIPHPVDSTDDLPRYDGEDVTITFPEDLTVRDVDFIGLWCVLARQNFGHILINNSLVEYVPPFVPQPAVKTCKVLWADNFHISWIVDARNNKINLTFEGVVAEGEYMAFGISGQDSVTSMVGSDVTVVWINSTTDMQGQAQDYYLNAYSQCTPDDGRGACPDELQENGVENVVLISAEVRDGVTVITVERPLTTSDPRDKDIPTSGDVAVSWGIGFINPTGHVAKHHTRATGNVIVDFGASSSCPVLIGPSVTPETVEPWTIEPLYPSEDTPMVAVIGPAGDRRGYQGIAGQVGWGLAWYINGSIIPEIHVERGKTYTFEVYGGDDPSFLGTYHPFYITDSKDGGYDQKTESDKQLETIYAAPVEGTLCEYMGGANPEDFDNFEDYFQTLNLMCPENAQAGVLRWRVAEDTPDLVYYQCYQHRFFGWKIHVSDPGLNMTTTTMSPPVTTAPTTQYYGKFIGSFEDGRRLHDVAGKVYAIDNKRLWIRGFSYDGEAPDAHFFVGGGSEPSANGISIPDENGLYTELSSYSNDNIILTFPDGVTLQTIEWISVWCVEFQVDFGSVLIPLNFDPPAPHSLGELGFTPRVHNVHADDVTILNTKQIKFTNLFYDGFGPDAYFWTGNGTPDYKDTRIPHPVDSTDDLPRYDGEDVTITFPEDLTVRDVDFIGLWCVLARQNFGHILINNSLVEYVPPFVPQPAVKTCKVLWADNFHISWIVDARNNKINLTFEGVVAEGEYMAFGISGQDSVTSMVGSDVTVVWINSTTDMQGQAQDYYLNAYSQCTPDDGRGACPDELQENGVENVVLISAEVRDGVTVITVERPLTTSDPRDKDIPTSGDVAVSWGIGFINPTGHVAKHHTRATGNVIVDFGASSSCPVLIGPSVTPETVEPWTIEPLYPSEDTPMVAVIGPAGDRRGYQGIAGQVGWGLAWYINGSIIPEIHVERGKTYTFEVYGGDDPSFLGTYHPFYITDSKDGGYDQKTESDKQLETIYAAPVEGTLCEYMGGANPEDFDNFEDYFQTLNLMCPENAQAGVLRWRVAEDTPDLVYYQCYQHRFFGWKIHVSDPGLNMTTTTMSPPVTTAPTTQYYGKFIGSFEDGRRLHDVAGKVYAIDNKRLWIRGFSYDGEAPDAHFFVGGGSEPSANGISIPDENGLYTELSSYSNDNIILTFPDGVTLQTIEWISVWCVEFQVDFGSVLIPLNFDPPAPHSLGELGFTPRVHNVHADDVTILNTKQIKFTNLFYDGFGPDAYFWTGNGTPDYKDTRIPHPVDSTDDLPRYDGEDVTITFPEDLTVRDVDFIGLWCVLARQNFGHILINKSLVEYVPPFVPQPAVKTCKVLWADNFHISWIVDARNNKINLTFEGVVAEGEYMAFGISGQDSVTSMVGSDVTVVWINSTTDMQGQAQDYYLNAYSQCTPDDGRGACPDELQENGVENVVLISAEVRDGVTVITVERPLTTSDPRDKDIPTSGDVAVSWGIGFINPTGHVAKHHTRATGNVIVDFGASSSCPVLIGPSVTPETVEPWTIEPLYPSEDTPMVAVIGPAGDRRGYQGIAGQVGWGLAWYINGSIIPEIHVERGKTYTFEVYGGDDPSFLGTYHPFYITDSKDGGYDQKTESDKQLETIYAAPVEGTLCEYMGGANPEDFDNFEDYFQTLNLMCPENAQAGVLRWTVAEDTPDLVYYQCYQHRFFGWKIHVSDPGLNMTTTTMSPPVTTAPTTQYYGKFIGSFEDGRTLHDVAGKVYAIDNRRLWIRGFTYDGHAPDAHFFVGGGSKANANGIAIPDENGLYTKLSRYLNDNIILTFPDGVTLQTIEWISVWCVAFRVDFGSVLIPLNFDPPAPKSLGPLGFSPPVHKVRADDVTILNTKQIKFTNLFYDGFGPDAYFWTGKGAPDRNDRRVPHPPNSRNKLPKFSGNDVTITFPEDLMIKDVDFIGLWCVLARQNFGHVLIDSADVENIPPYVPEGMENCQVLLEDTFHISWLVDARNNKLQLTFQGVVEEGEYMAFGRSGSDFSTSMIRSDVIVVWIDPKTHKARAEDYYLNDYSQCLPDNGRGACPDLLQGGDDDITLKNAEVRNGVTIITVERPLETDDPKDRDIPATGSFFVSWGIGFINPTGHVAKHETRALGSVTVDFGTSSSCPALDGPTDETGLVKPWTIEPLYPSEDTPLVAVIGPAAGQRGYQGIAGQVGWGLVWYINGSIIPEIHVKRGKTYTFRIYGGDDPSFLGTYHPFYISDSKDGGYDQKTESEKKLETIYAGPEEGTLCEYTGDENPEDYDKFKGYFQTLDLGCPGNARAGVLRWTVAKDTPDLVYYQCYQHRFFGWKIHVSAANRVASYSLMFITILSVLSTSILWS